MKTKRTHVLFTGIICIIILLSGCTTKGERLKADDGIPVPDAIEKRVGDEMMPTLPAVAQNKTAIQTRGPFFIDLRKKYGIMQCIGKSCDSYFGLNHEESELEESRDTEPA